MPVSANTTAILNNMINAVQQIQAEIAVINGYVATMQAMGPVPLAHVAALQVLSADLQAALVKIEDFQNADQDLVNQNP